MSSICLDKISHSCGTRGGLQVFEREDGSVDGYCFSCDTYVRHPYGGEEKRLSDLPKKRLGMTKAEVKGKMKEIASLSTIDLRDRRLRKDALEQFGIKIGLSEEDGKTPAFHHYPYTLDGKLVAYKTRLIEGKRMWSVGDQSDVDLFGWEQAVATGAKRLIIVEGECDAAALWKILEMYTEDKFKDYTPAVCSLPHGAASASKDIARLASKIRKHFKEISLAFDGDEPGQHAIAEVCKILPEATVVPLPAKDANECLISGLGKATFKAVTFNTQKQKNTRLVLGDELHEAAKKPAEHGFSWPWDSVNKVTKGIRLGETIYIGAGQKQGKSEVVNTLAAWFMKEHDWKVLLAKPEEANNKTYKMVAGKMVDRIFYNPDIPFDEDAYERAGEGMRGKLYMLNLYQHLGWDTLKGDIRAAVAEGVSAVFIDPVTNLTNGISAADANVKLQEIAQELSAMALDLNIVIFIFCHLRNPDSGEPHERGGKVLSSQFAGSRAMARSCNLMFGLEGNRDPELSVIERNTRYLVLLEDREYGQTGKFGLYWDENSGAFNEL